MGSKKLMVQFKSDFGRAWPAVAMWLAFVAGIGWIAFNRLFELVF